MPPAHALIAHVALGILSTSVHGPVHGADSRAASLTSSALAASTNALDRPLTQLMPEWYPSSTACYWDASWERARTERRLSVLGILHHRVRPASFDIPCQSGRRCR